MTAYRASDTLRDVLIKVLACDPCPRRLGRDVQASQEAASAKQEPSAVRGAKRRGVGERHSAEPSGAGESDEILDLRRIDSKRDRELSRRVLIQAGIAGC